MNRLPVIFIGHGSPMNLIEENPWTVCWEDIASKIEKPRAILMISAHWFTEESLIQGDEFPEMIYDMYGFPDEIYEILYPTKTDKDLIDRVQELLGYEVRTEKDRGYDHGAYAPLVKMYPEADIPVVQLSVRNTATAKDWYDIGQKLQPLRDEGVLIIGSGNIVHNLRAVNPRLGDKAYPECVEFEERLLSYLTADSTDTFEDIFQWNTFTGAQIAAAYPDHLAPFFYCVGAAGEPEASEPAVLTQDYLWGAMSMTNLVWSN